MPGILELVGKTTKQEDRIFLEGLARRLSCTVEEADFAESSLKPSSTLASKLAAMKGKPFDPDSFLALIRMPVTKLPRGVHALRFTVRRADDGTGIKIKFDLLDDVRAERLERMGSVAPEANAPEDVPYYWHSWMRVNVGRKSLQNEMVYLDLTWITETRGKLRDALIAACSAPPDEPIDIRVQVIADFPK